MELTKAALETRRARFCAAMDQAYPDWDTALVAGRVDQYYFTGTMQDGILLIQKGNRYGYYVRKSYQRALDESPLEHIFPMNSYRDAAGHFGAALGNTYIDAEILPFAMLQRLQKYFKMASVGALDHIVRTVRAVKSPYELYWMEESGRQHHKLLTEAAPALLKEGMSEADFVCLLLERMLQYGYQGISRFSQFQTEMLAGQIGFGESSLCGTSFDGPGGSVGMGAFAPVGGNPNRRLQKGDLVFVDVSFGIQGYHSDKTQVYLFGGKLSKEAAWAHQACLELQQRAADMLRPGAIPSQIYAQCTADLPPVLRENFMGYKDRAVKFLGHGVGLHVDEFPVIARGFDAPLEENMTIALEPKKGVGGLGVVGVEDTYVITHAGGRCITGGGREIIII